jgi:hypothetical protein
MPDPGEPGSDDTGVRLETPSAAGRVVGAPSGGRTVHLVVRAAAGSTWSTSCPADVDGLPAGTDAREPALTLADINCRACRSGYPDAVAKVNRRNASTRRRHRADADAVRRFLAWAHHDPDTDFVPAEYAGDSRLHPMPHHIADALVDRWLGSRQAE